MTKIKMLITALSVFTVAGMTTACSKHRANKPEAAKVEPSGIGTEDVDMPATEQEILAEKLAASTAIAAKLKSIENNSYGAEYCDQSEAEAMVNGTGTPGTTNSLNLVMGDESVAGQIHYGATRIIERTKNEHCKVNALGILAKKANKKFIQEPALRGDKEDILDDKFDKNIDQAVKIAGIVGTMQDSIKSELDAVEQARAEFAEKADKNVELISRIKSSASAVETQVKTIKDYTNHCESETCTIVEKTARMWAERTEGEIKNITGNLSSMNVHAADDRVDAKNKVLEEKLAKAQSLRDQGTTRVKVVTNVELPSEEKGPNAKNGQTVTPTASMDQEMKKVSEELKQ